MLLTNQILLDLLVLRLFFDLMLSGLEINFNIPIFDYVGVHF